MSREKLPQVKGVAPAGQDTATFTLENGEVVTVTARDGTAMSPEGILFTDWRNSGPVYFIPSPHHRWQAKVWLGLYNSEPDSEEARFDKYLMGLASITEVDWTGNTLTLTYLNPEGHRCFMRSTGGVTVNFVDAANISRDQFARYPLRVAIQEEKEDFEYVTNFRVDHTPEGYAVLRALGWLAPLPALEDVRPVSLSEAAD